MYPRRRNNRKKILFVTAAILLVIGVVGGGYAFVKYRRDQRAKVAAAKHAQEVAEADKQAPEQTKQAITDNQKTNGDSAASDQTSQSIPTSKSAAASITTLEQSGNTVSITAKVTDATVAGKCVAQFTTTYDRPITKEVAGSLSGSTVTCGPVNINSTEFSYIGDWKATVTYYAGDSKAVSPERTINIK